MKMRQKAILFERHTLGYCWLGNFSILLSHLTCNRHLGLLSWLVAKPENESKLNDAKLFAYFCSIFLQLYPITYKQARDLFVGVCALGPMERMA